MEEINLLHDDLMTMWCMLPLLLCYTTINILCAYYYKNILLYVVVIVICYVCAHAKVYTHGNDTATFMGPLFITLNRFPANIACAINQFAKV